VVHEVDQHAHARDGEREADRHRERGHELAAVAVADGAQHDQRIREHTDEVTEHELIAAVSHEVAQHARRVLARGLRDGDQRQREAEPRDRDHRARDRREHRT
jgi:hypothetical protein